MSGAWVGCVVSGCGLWVVEAVRGLMKVVKVLVKVVYVLVDMGRERCYSLGTGKWNVPFLTCWKVR